MAKEQITVPFDLSRYRGGVARAEEAAREVETGADATMQVGRWTRYVAGQEARAGGEFEAALDKHGKVWAPFAREVFSRGFALEGDAPIDTDGEELHVSRQWIAKAHEVLDGNEQLRAELDNGKGDAWRAGMFVNRVVNVVAEYVQPPEESSEDIEKQIEALKEMMGSGMTDAGRRAINRLRSKKRKAQKVEKAMVKVLGGSGFVADIAQAVSRAAADAAEIDAALDAFGMGAGDEGATNLRIGGDRSALIEAFRHSCEFRRIAKLAGRMRSRALQKQRDRAPDGRVELSALKRGSDLSRLTPNELGALTDPDREAALVRRLNEGAAEVYDLLGKEQRGDGPIIMLLDESGSMRGWPNDYVKAAAIAMLSVAALQKRAIAFIPFSGYSGTPIIIEDPEMAKPRDLVALSENFMDGGTAFAPPLEDAIDMLDESPAFKRADVIIVTDGDSYDEAAYSEAIDTLKAKGAHMYALLVGDEASDDLASYCDESMRIEPNAEGAFDGLFSI